MQCHIKKSLFKILKVGPQDFRINSRRKFQIQENRKLEQSKDIWLKSPTEMTIDIHMIGYTKLVWMREPFFFFFFFF